MKAIPFAFATVFALVHPALAGIEDELGESYGVHGLLTLKIPLQAAGTEPAPMGLGFEFDIRREQSLFSRTDRFDDSTGARQPEFDPSRVRTFRIERPDAPAREDDADRFYDDRRF